MEPPVRVHWVLKWLGIASSSWYARKAEKPQRPGRPAKGIDPRPWRTVTPGGATNALR
jgi:hypothetical protein